jgi:ribosomal protein L7Ae-like RNA K-turn-binding protein
LHDTLSQPGSKAHVQNINLELINQVTQWRDATVKEPIMKKLTASSAIFIPPSQRQISNENTSVSSSRPLSPSIPPYYPSYMYQLPIDSYYSHHYQPTYVIDPNTYRSTSRKKKKHEPKTVIAKSMEEIQKQVMKQEPTEQAEKKKKKKKSEHSYVDALLKPVIVEHKLPEIPSSLPIEEKKIPIPEKREKKKGIDYEAKTKALLAKLQPKRKKELLLGDLIGSSIKDMKKSKRDVISKYAKLKPGKTILNVVPNNARKKNIVKNRALSISRNVTKGKQRMVPRKKRLSKLKKIIVQEREAKKEEKLKKEKEWFTEDEYDEKDEKLQKIEPKSSSSSSSSQIEIREYVTQPLDKEIDRVVQQMLMKLDKFQQKLKKKEPLKFKAKRRLVVGLREVVRGIKSKKIIAVIMAPNIEKIEAPGGLDSVVQTIIKLATEREIPIIYALSKRLIGRALGKQVKMSAVGIYSADGAFDEFKEALRLSREASAQSRTTQ